MRTTLALIATSREVVREGIRRERYMAIPLDDLGMVRPLDILLWPARKAEDRRGSLPWTREARLIGPGWVDVLGPVTSAAGHFFEAFSDGTTLFIDHVEAVGRKRATNARLQVRLPKPPVSGPRRDHGQSGTDPARGPLTGADSAAGHKLGGTR